MTFASAAEAFLDDVYGYLLYLTKDRALAEDLTGETFETALRRWRKFDPVRGTARTWLLAIARSTALDWFRADSRRRRREERAGAADERNAIDEAFEGFSPDLDAALQRAHGRRTRGHRAPDRARPRRGRGSAPARPHDHCGIDAPAPGAREARREDDEPMTSDLTTQLRAARPVAPPELRERVRAIASQESSQRRSALRTNPGSTLPNRARPGSSGARAPLERRRLRPGAVGEQRSSRHGSQGDDDGGRKRRRGGAIDRDTPRCEARSSPAPLISL